MIHRFRGGTHPEDKKDATRHKPVETLPPPQKVVLPMSMHIGAPCEPVVRPEQEVFVGQLVADSAAQVSAPIHSPVSGKVLAIDQFPHPNGGKVKSVVIENDGRDIPHESVRPKGSAEALTPDQLLRIVREAGLVGLGGAAFPTHVKILSARGKCDTLILNAAECEPYITADHRLMLEAPEEVIGGLRALIKLLEPKRTVIAVESNKRDAAETLRRTLPGKTDIELVVLRTRYPQGAEKQLIKSITGREVPPGKLPADVRCAVFNAATAAALHRAVTTGMPLTRRIVTITGSAVANAKNLSVPIGTPIIDVFNATGGFREKPAKVLTGGPMMGVAQYDLTAPLVKSCNALLAFAEDDMPPSGGDICIRCGRCVRACPMNLLPVYMYMNERKNRLTELEALRLSDCIECGSCSFVCPGRLHLVHSFRTGKQKLRDRPTGSEVK
ncbi:MAG: electron transport complex subunit RsxC [Oscillospiraceae bacterium]|jgi:electron transport complex protein RnfC|nr:electron transport complex subunit RsxC [Oscillospiraceae bacterium]